MNVKYVAKDLEWTEGMRENVSAKIILPLQKYLNSDNFDLTVHLAMDRKRVQQRKPQFEMWIVLQTFDGHKKEIIRRHGVDFYGLVSEVSSGMRARVRKTHGLQTRPDHTVWAPPRETTSEPENLRKLS